MPLSRDERLRRLRDARLYFVCEGLPGGLDPTPLLDAALRGGVDVLQLREKAPRCAEELVSLSEPFRRTAAEHGALFVLNDRPDLSLFEDYNRAWSGEFGDHKPARATVRADLAIPGLLVEIQSIAHLAS